MGDPLKFHQRRHQHKFQLHHTQHVDRKWYKISRTNTIIYRAQIKLFSF